MWIEVFSTGTHTAANGIDQSYNLDDLNVIVEKYNSRIAENPNDAAPLVKGHPKSDEPALGWVAKLAIRGNKIVAQVNNISPELEQDIQNERYKNFSIALMPDLTLRHIGVLGAEPPAVSGLNKNGIVYFHKDDEYCEMPSEALQDELTNLKSLNQELTDDLSATIATLEDVRLANKELVSKLQEFEQKAHHDDISNFAQSLVNSEQTHFSAAQIPAIVDVLEAAFALEHSNDTGEREFSAGNTTFSDKLKKLLQVLSLKGNNDKPTIHSSLLEGLNYSKPQAATENVMDNFSSGNVDTDRAALHKRIINYMIEHPALSYEEAMLKIGLI